MRGARGGLRAAGPAGARPGRALRVWRVRATLPPDTTLAAHRRAHTGEPPYRRAFVQNMQLIGHQRTHTGSGPTRAATAARPSRSSPSWWTTSASTPRRSRSHATCVAGASANACPCSGTRGPPRAPAPHIPGVREGLPREVRPGPPSPHAHGRAACGCPESAKRGHRARRWRSSRSTRTRSHTGAGGAGGASPSHPRSSCVRNSTPARGPHAAPTRQGL